MYKQIIIARKDLNMSPGKLAAQVSHGSMAFLTKWIQKNVYKIEPYKIHIRDIYGTGRFFAKDDLNKLAIDAHSRGEEFFHAKPVNPKDPFSKMELCEPYYFYRSTLNFTGSDIDMYEQWINGEFTKCVLKAKNKNQLLKAKTMAEELGMKEDIDFFLIKDNCHTELEPEEDGRTLTVIGFRPMDAEVIDKIGKKFRLYE